MHQIPYNHKEDDIYSFIKYKGSKYIKIKIAVKNLTTFSTAIFLFIM